MNEKPQPQDSNGDRARLTQRVGQQEARKLKARRQQHKALWLGFSVTGLIGWGVVVPSLLGLAAGIWIDAHYPRMHCWTLMLLRLGIFVGCLNAWYWISRELDAIRRDQEEQPEESAKEDKHHE